MYHCKYCNTDKDATEFKKGNKSCCKACLAVRSLKYYHYKKSDEKHMARVRENWRKYYWKNREERLRKKALRREEDREYQREYYKKNKQRIKERNILG